MILFYESAKFNSDFNFFYKPGEIFKIFKKKKRINSMFSKFFSNLNAF